MTRLLGTILALLALAGLALAAHTLPRGNGPDAGLRPAYGGLAWKPAPPVAAAPGPGAPATWEADHRATQDPSGAGQHENAVAVNPHNPDNAIVVARDFRGNNRNYLDATTDGGATWAEQLFPRPTPDLPYDLDPAIFFRPDGRAYLLSSSFTDWPNGGVYIAWSDDGGLTWSPLVQITPPVGHFDDKSWLAFDSTGGPHNGSIYVTWTRFGNAEIFLARSTDGGVTWGAPVQVSNGAGAGNNDGAQPVVLPDGTLLILFLHDANPGSLATLTQAVSTDGGQTFAPNTPLFPIQQTPFTLPGENWRIFTYHSLAYDPVRGWLTVIWPDYRDGATEGINILISRSTDAGATWTAPARLNDDPPGLVRDQMFPALAAAPDGRLTALWLDRRDDPNNRLYYAYARTSTDGGLTWGPGARVSSAPSDPNQNIPPGTEGIGDYIGIGAGPGVVWGAWVDGRNGNQDIYAARELFTPQPTPTITPTRTATPPIPTTTPCPIQFSDVDATNPFYPYIRCLACRGIVSGYADGTFRPGADVTRGQLAKILALAARLNDSIPTTRQTFADVPLSNPFWLWIERAAGHGYISGYTCGGLGEPCDPQQRPYFRWGANATRGQIAKIDSIAAGYADTIPTTLQTFQDVPVSNPFWYWIEELSTHEVISGYTCGGAGEPCVPPSNRPYFRWTASATRSQLAKITAITFYPNCQTPTKE